MARRVLVIGLGRFGSALAESAQTDGLEVIGVDSRMDPIDAIKDRLAHAVCLDATDIKALRGIEAKNCDIAVVAMGDSFESSVLCVHALKELGVKEIHARAQDTRQSTILTAIGATHVIEIEADYGRKFGRTLAKS
jgi:trk system potassium uptake protein